MNETVTLETRTIRSVLRRGIEPLNKAGIESARLDAEALLCHASGFDRAALYTRLDETCSARIEALFESFLEAFFERMGMIVEFFYCLLNVKACDRRSFGWLFEIGFGYPVDERTI